MHAYPETLLPDARSLLADAVDYAVIDEHVSASDFLAFFAASDWARRIERGSRSAILGLSGIELARAVLSDKTGKTEFSTARTSHSRTRAYWIGWILAYCQWATNRRFGEILQALPPDVLEQMYGVYHEAPDECFLETAERMLSETFPETRLKRIRTAYGCSQTRLSALSKVGLRSIQMYEQRQKDINRAEAGSVLRLARALGCEVEDLLEP